MPEAHDDPLARLRAATAAREAAGLGRVLCPRPPGPDPLTDLASNDYLGLARHARVIDAAATAARQWGTGATGSRLVTGSTALHAELESTLAGFLGAEAALVFSSGYLANLATVTALAPAAGAALAALQLLAADPGLARRVTGNAGRLAALAEELGFEVAPAGAAVVRIVLGDPGVAVAAQRICAGHGVRAGCFRPPSVPPGQSCLRLTARANLAEADFVAATRALQAVRDHVRTASAVGRK